MTDSMRVPRCSSMSSGLLGVGLALLRLVAGVVPHRAAEQVGCARDAAPAHQGKGERLGVAERPLAQGDGGLEVARGTARAG